MTSPTPRKATKSVGKKATGARKATPAKAAPKAPIVVVTMEYSKATSGTYVYSEVEDGTPVRTLYVRKDAFPGKAPTSITVAINAN